MTIHPCFVFETEQASHVADVLNVFWLIESVLGFEVGFNLRTAAGAGWRTGCRAPSAP